ncbi:MAG: terminase small subunit [Gammaproteobacteria bacterium]|nr:terminase small subunit [Gammaproteobacteria bacterium]MBD3767997.1 terminase small subunit [Gammaproteobacteria bacterium]
MTPKQQRFVDEYLIDLNATQAAIRAGYSERTAEVQGSRLLSNVKVKDAVRKAKSVRAEEAKIDAQWVLKQAVEMHKMATGEKPVHVVVRESNEDGMTATRSVQMHKTDLSAVGKALELIGKHVVVAAFENGSNINVGITVIDPFKRGEDESSSGGN